MSVQAAICEILAGDPVISGLVGPRIRPHRALTTDDRPFILVKAVERPWGSLEFGRAASGEAAVIVAAVSDKSEDEAHRIAEAVRSRIPKYLAAKGDRRITAAWEDEAEGGWDPVEDGGCNADWWTETVGLTVHWERVTP